MALGLCRRGALSSSVSLSESLGGASPLANTCERKFEMRNMFPLVQLYLLPALRAHPLVLQEPGVDALHVVGVPTGQDAQLVPHHVVVQADAAGLPVNLVPLRELFRWDLLQAGLG